MIVCVANIGSTSLKSAILRIDANNHHVCLGEANLDRINEPGESQFTFYNGEQNAVTEMVQVQGYENGIHHILSWYVREKIISSIDSINCVGFKCVLGMRNGANQLTPDVLSEMRDFLFVAPVHNGPYLDGIEEFKKIVDVPLIGVFEPSFHHSIPEYRKYLGIPYEWHDLGIKKYGFHGASHRYLAAYAYKMMGHDQGRIITIHLGGSSSICAHKEGASFDVNQDFSPNSGLLQGTRTGHVDGTALLFAMNKLGLSVEQAQNEISYNGGLKSMAGVGTDDMRTIYEAADSGSERAQMAVDLYVDGVRKCIGAYAAAMGGVDFIVIGGGIGENSREIRRLCIRDLDFMDIYLDCDRNNDPAKSQGMISTESSPVPVSVAKSNEAAVIAYFACRVLQEGRDLEPAEMVFRL